MHAAVKQRVQTLQNQHCLWVHGLAAVVIILAVFEGASSGETDRSLGLAATLPTQLWIALRAHQQRITQFELWLAVLTSTVSLCVTTWPFGGFNHPRVVSALSTLLPGMVAAFGFRVIPYVILEIVAFIAVTLVFDHQFGLERFAVSNPSNVPPLVDIAVFLGISIFFIVLIARLTRQQSIWLEELVIETQNHKETADRFLSNMSHEIRNPLHAIKGIFEEIHAETHEAETRSLAITGTQVSDRLKAIVDDVLDYQRLRDGKLTLHPVPFDLSAFRRDSLALVRNYQSSNKQVKHLSTASSDLPTWVMGDPNRCFQVLMNLVSNAFKFTERGSVTIDTSYDWDQEIAKLSVVDTGPGMDAETLNGVFQRFSQGSEGLKKGHSGSGLGLAITQELVHMMDGHLDVDSVPGQGTRITVLVPLPLCSEPAEVSTGAELASHFPDGEVDLTGITILSVDDDLLNLRLIKTPLEKVGACVLSASSGSEALSLFEQHSIDLVITDISMPEMDGLELADNIWSRSQHMPLIAVTGNAMPYDLDAYYRHGFVEALTKPLSRETLIGVVLRTAIMDKQH